MPGGFHRACCCQCVDKNCVEANLVDLTATLTDTVNSQTCVFTQTLKRCLFITSPACQVYPIPGDPNPCPGIGGYVWRDGFWNWQFDNTSCPVCGGGASNRLAITIYRHFNDAFCNTVVDYLVDATITNFCPAPGGNSTACFLADFCFDPDRPTFTIEMPRIGCDGCSIGGSLDVQPV